MNPYLWTSSEIASVTGGSPVGSPFSVTGISIDTRTLQRGDLFVAIQGQHTDGHQYIDMALKKGASGVIATSTMQELNGIIVEDTLQALNDMAAGARARSQASVFAITGSVGKTSAKEMLYRCLSSLGKTHAAEASLNNHWGVPLSLSRMPAESKYGVFEIGMNHANEISPLSKLVAPHCALITTIANAHIENLGTLENIALAKSEIFHGLDSEGVVILPRDSDQYALLLAEARTYGVRKIITFGKHKQSDFQLISVSSEFNHTLMKFCYQSKEYVLNLSLSGEHHAVNTLGVLACVSTVYDDLEKVFPTLEVIQPVIGRGNRWSFKIDSTKTPITVIDETHNASPIAVEAAIDVLSKIPTNGRHILILGDMLELGSIAIAEHVNLKKIIEKKSITHVWTCGKLMYHLHKAMNSINAKHFEDSASLASIINSMIQPGDILLIKGSRGSAMKRVIDALQLISHSKAQEQLKFKES